MELLHLWINLFIGLLTWSVSLSFVQRPRGIMPRIASQGHQKLAAKHEVQEVEPEVAERLKTVRVICHPDLLEVVIQADMFGIGAPVNAFELQLGVDDRDYCRATEYSTEEYKIVVGLMDCGTKHWVKTKLKRVKTLISFFLTCLLCTDGWGFVGVHQSPRLLSWTLPWWPDSDGGGCDSNRVSLWKVRLFFLLN